MYQNRNSNEQVGLSCLTFCIKDNINSSSWDMGLDYMGDIVI